MSNNNEDNSRYPHNIISRIRKKEEKRKKVLKITLTAICFALVFVIGFVSGFYYADSDKLIGSSTVKTSAKQTTADSDGTAGSDATKADKAKKSELAMLNNIKDNFVAKVSSISPDAKLSFAVKNLDTGEMVVYNNIQMNSASVIKLFIMETIYKEAAKNTYNLSTEKEELLFKMITDSDNDASNTFIDDFGGIDETRKIKADNTINRTIKESGYKFTEANRKMYNTTPPGGPTGYENYTCAEDVIKLLEGIYNKTLFEEPYNTHALKLLTQQVRREKLPKEIIAKYPDVIVANKTGELTQVENDVALIMNDNFNLAVAVFISDIPKTAEGNYDVNMHEAIRGAIADFGLEVVESYKSNNN